MSHRPTLSAPYVADVRAREVVVVGWQACPAWLTEFTTRDGAEGQTIISCERALQPKLLALLRDNGVAFAGGVHGWPPSAVFEMLREQGQLTGTFVEITFTGSSLRLQTR
jgi:hypothetical protein